MFKARSVLTPYKMTQSLTVEMRQTWQKNSQCGRTRNYQNYRRIRQFNLQHQLDRKQVILQTDHPLMLKNLLFPAFLLIRHM